MIEQTIDLTNNLLLLLYVYYIGIIVHNSRKKITLKQIISLLIAMILLILINKFFTTTFIVYFSSLVFLIYYKINYKNKTNLSLYCLMIIFLSLFISQNLLFFIIDTSYLKSHAIILTAFILTFILKKYIKIFIHNKIINKNITLINYLLLNLYPIYMIIKNSPQKQFLEYIIIFIILSLFLLIIILQEQKIEQLKHQNKELLKNSKNNEKLVINYRKVHHEYKNKLIIIKGMINPQNKKLTKYVEHLIKDPVVKKNKWLNELSDIPFIEIKNFLNYKINILERKRAKIEIFIGEEISTINTNKVDIIDINNINTIIGVILDNIIDSIQKINEKLVSINIYIENNTVNILLANTFSNDIDLTKINNFGYSTKGEKRGIGLTLVNDIIKSNKNLELETKIEGKFFIQHLKIKNIDKYLK